MKYLPALLLAATISAPDILTAQVVEIMSVSPGASRSDRIYPYWTVFEHPRYGYELPVPPEVSSEGVPEKAAETKFVSRDGQFVLTAWAGLTTSSQISVLDAQWKEAVTRTDRYVSRHQRGQSWFVVSGADKFGREFLEKCIVEGDHAGGFTVTYPRGRRWEFEQWILDIEEGFQLVQVASGAPAVAPRLVHSVAREEAREARLSETVTQSEFLLHAPQRWQLSETGSGRMRNPADREHVVDITPPPPRKKEAVDFAPKDLEPEEIEKKPATMQKLNLEKLPDTAADKPRSPGDASATPARTNSPPPAAELPIGQKVVGKSGFVYSPFEQEKRLVDVVDIAPGTRVKCPYTGKHFRVP